MTAATLGVLGGAGQAVAHNHTPIQSAVGQTGTLLAQTFDAIAINEANFLVVSVPGSAAQPHRLYIVEQVQPNPPCWSVANTVGGRTEINALWNTFDFSGVCRLQRDSNGYAIRLNGQDVAGARFEVNQRDGDLLLQFAPSTVSRNRITIGRTNGISSTGFARITLNPGWSLAKRTFGGQIVSSHLVYFTNDATLAQLQANEGIAISPGPGPGTGQPPVTPPPAPAFRDIQGNRYAADITRAAGLGVISGFAEDNTFRPTTPLTREQAVSVIIETAARILPTSVIAQADQQVSRAPFPDVAANRWSALKIRQAQQLGFVSGDAGTGNFRPTDNVSRAELMAMMYRVALVRANAGAGDTTSTAPVPGLDPATGGLVPNIANPPNFTDISGHWGANAIRQMAAVCAIATPLNETGTNFAPNTNALRDYTAAAAVRAIDCPAARPQ
ncbi:DUF3747 domain-containing protein [Nodosilinea sp. E11]|uniref:DUF3747 domain-containing protein n=1 Tax=Nodosilinea sp. E11 TaxID=3037479 RepID=UPI0029346E36|nr:DUF3747 domain-containing protein [Nodosilinea sp. E11]WOD38901.1 DUF3747 domain-containing protein [Nodosilinea sp. E11]